MWMEMISSDGKGEENLPIYEKMSSDMAEIIDLYVDENYLVYNTN